MSDSIQKIAQGLELVADGLAEVALQLRGIDAGVPTTVPAREALPFDDDFSVAGTTAAPTRRARPVPEEGVEYGHEAVCPKHRIPYIDKGRGPFCSAKSDEPKWTSEKGYCQITPKSAAAWLAQHAVGG